MPVPVIFVTGEESLTVGENYTLSCRVSVIEGLTDDALLAISWTDSGGDVIQSDLMLPSGVNTTSTLVLYPLLLSSGGEYICHASITISSISLVKRNSEPYNVVIQSKLVCK